MIFLCSDWLAAVIKSVSVYRHSNLSLPYERDGDHFLADRLVHQGTPKFKKEEKKFATK